MPRISEAEKQLRAQAAINNPVNAPVRELEAAQHPVPQKAPIDLGHRLENDPEGIAIVDALPKQDYMDALKFAEDPVTVVLPASSDPKAAKLIYCAVNGKGAEVWDERSKRWIEFKYLPVSRQLTVKRKYLEVLARSRTDAYNTREITTTPHANQDGFVLESVTVPAAPFNVISDPAGPKGHEWYARVMAEF